MQGANNDIHAPFSVRPSFAIIVVIILVMSLLIRIFGGRFLRYFTIRSQRKAIEQLRAHRPALVQEIIARISVIQQAHNAGSVSSSDAAAQLSAVVREGFDSLMNHRTMAQSKSEILQRQLDKLVHILDGIYPAEFSGTQHTPLNQHMFESAKEVILSCR